MNRATHIVDQHKILLRLNSSCFFERNGVIELCYHGLWIDADDCILAWIGGDESPSDITQATIARARGGPGHDWRQLRYIADVELGES